MNTELSSAAVDVLAQLHAGVPKPVTERQHGLLSIYGDSPAELFEQMIPFLRAFDDETGGCIHDIVIRPWDDAWQGTIYYVLPLDAVTITSP